MNRRLLPFAGMVLAMSVVSGGCTPPGENLVKAGVVSVERQDEGAVKVTLADVYQHGGTLIVDATLRRSGIGRQESMGHVDVAVVERDGTILAQKSFRDNWKHCDRSTFFWARLPVVAPKGSTVRVVFHDSADVPDAGHTAEQWQSLWTTR